MKLLSIRKKIFRKLQGFSSNRLVSLITSLAIVIVVIITLQKSELFLIRKISCQLDDFPCPQVLQPLLTNLHKQNLLTLNSSKIKRELIDLDPLFGQITISKHLPSSLSIIIIRQFPVAQLVLVETDQLDSLISSDSASLSAELTGSVFNLDRSGKTYQPHVPPPPTLPVIYTSSLDSSIWVAQLVDALQQHYVSYQSLAWVNQQLAVIQLSSVTTAWLDPQKNLTIQVASLQYILRGSKIDEEIPTKIDLRFDKPILTY